MSENDKLARGWWSIPGSGVTVMRMTDPYADFVYVLTDPSLYAQFKADHRPYLHDTRYPR
jgi:hypothetical protein